MHIGVRLPEGGDDPSAAVDLAVVAEALGFDGAYLGEHHGFAAYWPSPHLVLAAIAARTSHLVVGTNVLLLPLAQPVRLAGEVALLDRLSGGRVVLGVGLGWLKSEYAALGTQKRFRGADADEALTVMTQLWRGDPVTTVGRTTQLDAFTLTPTPLAPGGPPIWVGGGSPAALARAARFGRGWTAGSTLGADELREGYERCDVLRDGLGLPPAPDRPVTRHVVLGATREEALAQAEAYVRQDHRLHLAAGNPMVRGAWDDGGVRALVERAHLVGTAEDVAAGIEVLRAEAGVTHLLAKFPGRLDGGALREQMEDFMAIVGRDRTDMASDADEHDDMEAMRAC